MPLHARNVPRRLRARKGDERDSPVRRPAPAVRPEQHVESAADHDPTQRVERPRAGQGLEAGRLSDRPRGRLIEADPVAFEGFPYAVTHARRVGGADSAREPQDALALELAEV